MIKPWIDPLILSLDRGLRTLFSESRSHRPHPDRDMPEPEHPLTAVAQRRSARLMRVNHCGEICAQALYHGQALVARNTSYRHVLHACANEEREHLAWTAQRITELGGRKSVLNPAWYAGSMLLGAAAGLFGDRWSASFLAETERQVVRHLDTHLNQLPPEDQKSHAIVTQMRHDEHAHANHAAATSAGPLPWVVRTAMAAHAKMMTTMSYWI